MRVLLLSLSILPYIQNFHCFLNFCCFTQHCCTIGVWLTSLSCVILRFCVYVALVKIFVQLTALAMKLHNSYLQRLTNLFCYFPSPNVGPMRASFATEWAVREFLPCAVPQIIFSEVEIYLASVLWTTLLLLMPSLTFDSSSLLSLPAIAFNSLLSPSDRLIKVCLD